MQDFQPQNKKYFDLGQKSYGEYTKVEKPVVMTMSYEGQDKEEEHETVPVVLNNSNVNVVSHSDSDYSEDDLENDEDNPFNEDINDQVKTTPPNHYQHKSGMSYEKAPSFIQL